jgi:hypothetical protein
MGALVPCGPLREVLLNLPGHNSIHKQIAPQTSIIPPGFREKETKKETNERCLSGRSRREVIQRRKLGGSITGG